MSDNWWPTPLAHIAAEKPWDNAHVVVAEVRTFDEQPHAGQRVTFAALVPVDEVDFIKKSLADFEHEVSASGPHPYYQQGKPYHPEFWIGVAGQTYKKYEPLVVEWMSHDITVLQPDAGFLMTYGLMPRHGKNGVTHWDDPQGPAHEIVNVGRPSVWDFPLATGTFVSIRKDYLQDYLTLRQVALVQVFWEMRWASMDPDTKEKLGENEGVNVDFADRRFQLGRDMVERDIVYAQVWGARLVALPGPLPINSDSLEDNGLIWPGIERPVTNSVARTLGVTEWAYVRDAVLAEFEGRAGFRINPETGSVSFGTQWSVGHCTRVGRDLIRVELKKLYEGVPPNIIRHWHKFSEARVPVSAYPEIRNEPNIAKRARDITFAVVDLGEAIANIAHSVGLVDLTPESFVSLRRSALDYSGWWTFSAPEQVARHVPLTLSIDSFLNRCMSLDKLIIEGLSERGLRQTLQATGIPAEEIAKFRNLKLLDRLVRLVQIADSTGLNISKDGATLWARLAEENTTPEQPISLLFALHDIRGLNAHKAGNLAKELQNELERFDILPDEAAGGYGRVLDSLYDRITADLSQITAKIKAAL